MSAERRTGRPGSPRGEGQEDGGSPGGPRGAGKHRSPPRRRGHHQGETGGTVRRGERPWVGGGGPSTPHWAALEVVFFRVKLVQFTATFCRVCLAESRQNLTGRGQPRSAPSPSGPPGPASSQPLHASSPAGRAQPSRVLPSPFEILHFSVSLIHLCPIQVLGQEHIIWESKAESQSSRAERVWQLGKGPP